QTYLLLILLLTFFFSSRRRHTRFSRDWSSDVCSSDLSNMATTRAISNPATMSFAPGLARPGPSRGSPSRPAKWRNPSSFSMPARSEERRVGKEDRRAGLAPDEEQEMDEVGHSCEEIHS